MKVALAAFIALLGCKRPVERTVSNAADIDAAVTMVSVDADLIDDDDFEYRDAPAAPVTTTVIKVETFDQQYVVLTLAAGEDQQVGRRWTVTFLVDNPGSRPLPRCLIFRVDKHETLCKLDGTKLPSSVVRIAP
jgi:hypothetical protein